MNIMSLEGTHDTAGFANDSRLPLDGLSANLARYWHEALNLKLWIAGILSLGVFWGMIATLVATEQFRATARIEIWFKVEDVTNANSRAFTSYLAESQYYNTQYELLRSPSIAQRVIDAGALVRNNQLIDAYGLSDLPQLDDGTLKAILLGGVSITPVPQSGLVDISYTSPDPETSAMVANLWAEEFLAANYNKLFGANVDAQSYLRGQISELRERLSESERELVSYANQHGIIIVEGAPSPGSDAARETLIGTELAHLNASLANATADRIASESRLVAGARGAAARGAEDAVREQIAKARADLAQMQASFGPGYPAVLSKQAEIQALEVALADQAAIVSSEAQAEYDAALHQEQELRALMQSTKDEFLKTQDQSIQYGILSREVETNRQLYDALLQRLKSLEASGAGRNNMRLVEQANAPRRPISPSLQKNLLLGLLVGGVISAAFVWLRVALDQTVWDPADVNDLLGLAPIGHIPYVEDGRIREEIGLGSSVLSEAYASVRTNITFLTQEGAPRSILITSTRANEGKSLSAISLSTSFARLGRRTLLVDADLRNSGTEHFVSAEGHSSIGLSGLLTGRGALQDATVAIPDLGIDLLPVGHLPPNPVELLAGPRLTEIIKEAEGIYDQVVVDGAPLLDLADAIEASKAVSGVLMVVEANGPKLRAIENAITRLQSANAQIYGALVTKLRPHNAAYDYGYGSTYGRPVNAEA